MDRRADLLRQWIAAETETEATEAVIALAVEQMTARDAQSSEREDVSDHQRGRIDELEKRIEQIEQGLAETSRFCTALGDDVQALLHGYRCARPEPVAPEAAPKEREG